MHTVYSQTQMNAARSLNNLAILCYYEQNLPEAAALMRRALTIFQQVLGPQHPDTQSSRRSLAVIEAAMQQAASSPPAPTQEQ